MKNIACRIFKEQIDLINELPKEDRANVLYSAIMSAYNQFENQNEIQTENQIEYAYISLSISKSIFNLLSKNIVFKEYNNYGGKRENSGRPKNQKIHKNQNNQTNQKEIYKEKFEEWWSYFPKLRAGSKAKTFEKYLKAIEKEKLTPEWLLERVKEYSESEEVKKGFACGGERYFNDCKYNNQYKSGTDINYLEQSLQELGL